MKIANQQAIQEELYLRGIDIQQLLNSNETITKYFTAESLTRFLKDRWKTADEVASTLDIKKHHIIKVRGLVNKVYEKSGVPVGYTLIPIGQNSRLCINLDGIVIDFTTRLIKDFSLNHKGYKRITGHITLNDGTVRRQHFLHRLMAIAFIPNTDSLETVNHIDGDILNNSVGNLEWLSNADNYKHSVDVLTNRQTAYKGTGNGRSKLTNDKVIEYRKLHNDNKTTPAEIASIENMHISAVSRMLAGKSWSHI